MPFTALFQLILYTRLFFKRNYRKIQRVLPECGPPLDEVLTLISEAAEHRLRGILAQLAVITEHRLEPLRNHPCYQVSHLVVNFIFL